MLCVNGGPLPIASKLEGLELLLFYTDRGPSLHRLVHRKKRLDKALGLLQQYWGDGFPTKKQTLLTQKKAKGRIADMIWSHCVAGSIHIPGMSSWRIFPIATASTLSH